MCNQLDWTINPNLFFLLEEKHLIVWDYKSHTQFSFDYNYATALLAFIQQDETLPQEIFQEFIDADILVQKDLSSNLDWKWDPLSKIFHYGTMHSLADISQVKQTPKQQASDYITYSNKLIGEVDKVEATECDSGTYLKLPKQDIKELKDLNFLDVIMRRKTCRDFFAKNCPLSVLSTLLYYSFGEVHGDWLEEVENKTYYPVGTRKTSPSAGALHPNEFYVVIYNVEMIPPGIYLYKSKPHALKLVKEGQFEETIIEYNFKQYYSKGLSFGVYITINPEKIWTKYLHSRAYKISLLEVGHLSQTFQLCATALSLNTWLTGAICDKEIKEILQLQGKHEFPVLFLGAGYGSNNAIPSEIAECLDKN